MRTVTADRLQALSGSASSWQLVSSFEGVMIISHLPREPPHVSVVVCPRSVMALQSVKSGAKSAGSAVF